MQYNSLFPKALAGAAAGFVATVPMTITMLAIQRLGRGDIALNSSRGE